MKIPAVLVCLLVALAPLIAVVADAAAEGPELLVNGDFSAAEPLAAWQLWQGARTGETPQQSTARCVSGAAGPALEIAGDEATSLWMAVVQVVPVQPGETLRVTGRIKTAGVQPAARQFANCNLIVVFEGTSTLAVRAHRARLGSQDWESVAVRATAPPGAQRARIGCFLSCRGVAWFDDLSARVVDPPVWQRITGRHYDLHALPGDLVTDADLAFDEAALERAAARLEVTWTERIAYYKYPDAATKEEFTSDPGNAHVAPDRNEIHSRFARDTHEVVHLLTRSWGSPPALLGEGIAVHLAGHWHGKPNRKHTAEFIGDGRYVPLAVLCETRQFRQQDDHVSYPESGAFVEFLLATGGLAKFRALYAIPRAGETAADFAQAFAHGWGVPLDAAEADFRTWALGR